MNVITLDLEPKFMSRGPLGGKRVLLVEDSATSAAIMSRMVRGAGGRFRRADGVEAAMRHLRSFRPDILIVDPGLPDGCGLELIRQLHATRLSRPRIVVMSGSDCEGEAMATGADAFLLKPVGRMELIGTLASGPIVTNWQQAATALAPDITTSLVTDLRRAQLWLLEARVRGHTADEAAFALDFIRSALDMADEPELDDCRDAVARRDIVGVLAELKLWLSVVDPMTGAGEGGGKLRSVAGG